MYAGTHESLWIWFLLYLDEKLVQDFATNEWEGSVFIAKLHWGYHYT